MFAFVMFCDRVSLGCQSGLECTEIHPHLPLGGGIKGHHTQTAFVTLKFGFPIGFPSFKVRLVICNYVTGLLFRKH